MKKIVMIPIIMSLFITCASESLITRTYQEGYAEEFSAEVEDGEVVILFHPTDFKYLMTQCLAYSLNQSNYSVTADVLSNGAMYNPVDYQAVILLSEVQAFHPLPLAASFIKYHDYAENIVYVSTYALFDKPYTFSLNRRKIDAISSASITNNQTEFDDLKETIMIRTLEVMNL